MATIKKLYFANGTDVTAPTDLSFESSTNHLETYANDAAYVTANGTATEGDIYLNTTLEAPRMYLGGAWRTGVMASDAADATKTFAVDLTGATTGTTQTLDFNSTASRIYTFPDYAGIVVLNTGSETNPVIFANATGNTDIGNISGTVRIKGNLEVQGTTTSVNSTNLEVTDQNILINDGGSDLSADGAGLTVDRVSTDGSLIFDSTTTSKWKCGLLGSEVEITDRTSSQTLTNKSLSGSANTFTNIPLTSAVTGQLPLANGGTGTNYASNNALLNGILPTQSGNAGKYLQTDGTNTSWASVTGGSGSTAPTQANNYTLSTSVGSSQLTIALKTLAGSDPSGGDPVEVAFRNATSATGTYSIVQSSAATSLVVSSGATLGHTSAVATYFYVYLINNAGSIEMAVSTKLFDTGSIVSTTAMSGSATSATVMYSTTARTNVACRLIARMLSTQTTAGTWAAVPTEISLGHYFVTDGRYGRQDGLTVPQYQIGEFVQAALSTGSQTAPTGSAVDITNSTITLTPGVWQFNLCVSGEIAGGPGDGAAEIAITDSSNVAIPKGKRGVATSTSTDYDYGTLFSVLPPPLSISTTTSYKLRFVRLTTNGNFVFYHTNASMGDSYFYALRIA